MKAKIEKVEFQKEYQTKFGTLFLFKVHYDGKVGFYSSKKKDQKKFVAGKDAEFSVYEKSDKDRVWTIIKPIYEGQQQSNYSRKQKAEQSRYSGFAVSYAKDLVVADKLPIAELGDYATVLFNLMVELDKTLLS